MSWVVEQSENASAVRFNGDTIICLSESPFGSRINAMYKDPADRNGQYYWQFEFKKFEAESYGNCSVGLTTKQAFQPGYRLRAMRYLGSLSDGGSLLKSSFGDCIKINDKVGILLQLTDADLKMYIFHNDRPLGLAFHIQSPYPKPLYPVVSFSPNGKVKISRLQQIPSSLDRAPLQFTGFEGVWKVVDYPQHPEFVGDEFQISRDSRGPNFYCLCTSIANDLTCSLEYKPTTNEWKSLGVIQTLMLGSSEEMEKEGRFSALMSNIHKMKVQDEKRLIIKTKAGDKVRLERFIREPPAPVTHNIFN